jgi:hypothetical protein
MMRENQSGDEPPQLVRLAAHEQPQRVDLGGILGVGAGARDGVDGAGQPIDEGQAKVAGLIADANFRRLGLNPVGGAVERVGRDDFGDDHHAKVQGEQDDAADEGNPVLAELPPHQAEVTLADLLALGWKGNSSLFGNGHFLVSSN